MKLVISELNRIRSTKSIRLNYKLHKSWISGESLCEKVTKLSSESTTRQIINFFYFFHLSDWVKVNLKKNYHSPNVDSGKSGILIFVQVRKPNFDIFNFIKCFYWSKQRYSTIKLQVKYRIWSLYKYFQFFKPHPNWSHSVIIYRLNAAPCLNLIGLKLSCDIGKTITEGVSVTRWLDYFPTFGHLHQWKLAQWNIKIANVDPKFSQMGNQPSKNCPRLWKFCQNGKISPNLVTLEGEDGRLGPKKLIVITNHQLLKTNSAGASF